MWTFGRLWLEFILILCFGFKLGQRQDTTAEMVKAIRDKGFDPGGFTLEPAVKWRRPEFKVKIVRSSIW